MHSTVAGDRGKALKMSARKLARDARARRRPPAHPRPAWRRKGCKCVRLALAEAEALRLDDLTVWENGDFGQREPEGLLHLPDGWR